MSEGVYNRKKKTLAIVERMFTSDHNPHGDVGSLWHVDLVYCLVLKTLFIFYTTQQHMKKLLASVSATLVVLTSVLPSISFGASIPTEYVDAYEFMYNNSLTSTKSAEAFMPFSTLSREALARFAVNFYTNVLKKTTKVAGMNCSFSDASQVDSTLTTFTMDACAYGLMKGYDGKFMPKGTVTRGQIITVLSRMMDGSKFDTTDTTDADFYRDHAQNLITRNIITSINANANVLRGDASLMFKRAGSTDSTDDLSSILDGLLNGTGTTTTTGVVTNIVEVKAGNLNVAISPVTPPSQSVPRNGNVTFAKMDLTAGGSDVNLYSIKIARSGLGQRSDINRVYFSKNGVRVSGRTSIAADETATISFAPALIVKANGKETIDLVVELSGSLAWGQHRFSVFSANDIVSSALNSSATFPLQSNLMTTADYEVANVHYEPTTGASQEYKVGDTNVELGRFTLTNKKDRDLLLKAIAIRNGGAGDISKNLSNLALYRGSDKVSSTYTVLDRDLTFVLSGELSSNGSNTFILRGDIIGAEDITNSFQFQLRNTQDLVLSEKATSFDAKVTFKNTSDGYMRTYAIKGSDVTLTKKTYDSVMTIAQGTQQVVLFDGEIKAKQAITLEDLKLVVSTWISSNEFTRIWATIGNSSFSINLSNTLTTTLTLDGTALIPAGATVSVKVYGQVANNVVRKNTPFTFSAIPMAASTPGFASIRYTANDNTVQSTELIGSIAATTATIGDAGVTFARNDGLTTSTVVKGAQNFKVFGFRITNGNVSKITVNNINLPINVLSGTTQNLWTLISNVRLVEASNPSNVIKNASVSQNTSGLVASFQSLALQLNKGESKDYAVIVNLNTTLSANTTIQAQTANGDYDQDGSSATQSFIPSTVGNQFSVIDGGKAFFTLDTSSNGGEIIDANKNLFISSNKDETEVLRMNVRAEQDDLRLTHLFLINTGTITSNLNQRFPTIALYVDSITPANRIAVWEFGTSGRVAFTNINNVSIARDQIRRLIVTATAGQVSTLADTGTLQLVIDQSTNNTGSSPVALNWYTADKVMDYVLSGTRFVSNNASATTTVASNINLGNTRTHSVVRSYLSMLPGTSNVISSFNKALQFNIKSIGSRSVLLSGLSLRLDQVAGSSCSVEVHNSSDPSGNSTLIGSGTVTCNSTPATQNIVISMLPGTEITTNTGGATYTIRMVGFVDTVTSQTLRPRVEITDASFVDQLDNNTIATYNNAATLRNNVIPATIFSQR